MLPLEIVGDRPQLAVAAADRIVRAAEDALGRAGRFTLAVSGGATPLPMFDELARRPLRWDAIHVFQVDERIAPPGHPDRNLTGLDGHLLSRVDIPPGNVHPMPVDEPNLSAAAGGYAEEIRRATGGHGVFDLVHLGLGDDGHTASWPPGDPVVDEPELVSVAGPYRGYVRMTLTPAAVNRAGQILWLVEGAPKAPALRRLIEGDPAIPAARARRDRVLVLAGADAAGNAV